MNALNTVRILSRKSDLAIIQAKEVGANLLKEFPDLNIEYLTKSTLGDKDLNTPLSQMPTAGVFTDDLREYLINKKCDMIVHSWKDLPLDLGSKTIVAGTLARADQRDILFLKKNSINKIKENKKISILSSSPRRIYNLESFVKDYLPFELDEINFMNIRGNIPTRFKKFIKGEEDAFVVAKAAIDRLSNNNLKEFNQISNSIKDYINKCLWTITPLSINPTSPGQGALACEIRNEDNTLNNMIKKINHKDVFDCAEKERKVLKKYGGGCHQKIGVSFFPMFFGLVHSEKGETDNGHKFSSWKINDNFILNEKISEKDLYPSSLKNYNLFSREEIKESIELIESLRNHCILVSRKSSLPIEAKIHDSNIIWSSGTKTWKALANRGVWINGTADGMGENVDPRIETLTSYPWIKLTHLGAPKNKIKESVETYKLLEMPIKEDIRNKKYFYWMSSSAFKYVKKYYPEIINANHSCGPGNTYIEIKKIITDPKKLSIALSYNSWKEKLLND